jgi:hypothetical protein
LRSTRSQRTVPRAQAGDGRGPARIGDGSEAPAGERGTDAHVVIVLGQGVQLAGFDSTLSIITESQRRARSAHTAVGFHVDAEDAAGEPARVRTSAIGALVRRARARRARRAARGAVDVTETPRPARADQKPDAGESGREVPPRSRVDRSPRSAAAASGLRPRRVRSASARVARRSTSGCGV